MASQGTDGCNSNARVEDEGIENIPPPGVSAATGSSRYKATLQEGAGFQGSCSQLDVGTPSRESRPAYPVHDNNPCSTPILYSGNRHYLSLTPIFQINPCNLKMYYPRFCPTMTPFHDASSPDSPEFVLTNESPPNCSYVDNSLTSVILGSPCIPPQAPVSTREMASQGTDGCNSNARVEDEGIENIPPPGVSAATGSSRYKATLQEGAGFQGSCSQLDVGTPSRESRPAYPVHDNNPCSTPILYSGNRHYLSLTPIFQINPCNLKMYYPRFCPTMTPFHDASSPDSPEFVLTNESPPNCSYVDNSLTSVILGSPCIPPQAPVSTREMASQGTDGCNSNARVEDEGIENIPPPGVSAATGSSRYKATLQEGAGFQGSCSQLDVGTPSRESRPAYPVHDNNPCSTPILYSGNRHYLSLTPIFQINPCNLKMYYPRFCPTMTPFHDASSPDSPEFVLTNESPPNCSYVDNSLTSVILGSPCIPPQAPVSTREMASQGTDGCNSNARVEDEGIENIPPPGVSAATGSSRYKATLQEGAGFQGSCSQLDVGTPSRESRPAYPVHDNNPCSTPILYSGNRHYLSLTPIFQINPCNLKMYYPRFCPTMTPFHDASSPDSPEFVLTNESPPNCSYVDNSLTSVILGSPCIPPQAPVSTREMASQGTDGCNSNARVEDEGIENIPPPGVSAATGSSRYKATLQEGAGFQGSCSQLDVGTPSRESRPAYPVHDNNPCSTPILYSGNRHYLSLTPIFQINPCNLKMYYPRFCPTMTPFHDASSPDSPEFVLTNESPPNCSYVDNSLTSVILGSPCIPPQAPVSTREMASQGTDGCNSNARVEDEGIENIPPPGVSAATGSSRYKATLQEGAGFQGSCSQLDVGTPSRESRPAYPVHDNNPCSTPILYSGNRHYLSLTPFFQINPCNLKMYYPRFCPTMTPFHDASSPDSPEFVLTNESPPNCSYVNNSLTSVILGSPCIPPQAPVSTREMASKPEDGDLKTDSEMDSTFAATREMPVASLCADSPLGSTFDIQSPSQLSTPNWEGPHYPFNLPSSNLNNITFTRSPSQLSTHWEGPHYPFNLPSSNLNNITFTLSPPSRLCNTTTEVEADVDNNCSQTDNSPLSQLCSAAGAGAPWVLPKNDTFELPPSNNMTTEAGVDTNGCQKNTFNLPSSNLDNTITETKADVATNGCQNNTFTPSPPSRPSNTTTEVEADVDNNCSQTDNSDSCPALNQLCWAAGAGAPWVSPKNDTFELPPSNNMTTEAGVDTNGCQKNTFNLPSSTLNNMTTEIEADVQACSSESSTVVLPPSNNTTTETKADVATNGCQNNTSALPPSRLCNTTTEVEADVYNNSSQTDNSDSCPPLSQLCSAAGAGAPWVSPKNDTFDLHPLQKLNGTTTLAEASPLAVDHLTFDSANDAPQNKASDIHSRPMSSIPGTGLLPTSSSLPRVNANSGSLCHRSMDLGNDSDSSIELKSGPLFASQDEVYKKLGQTHLARMNLDPKGANNQIKEAIDKRYLPEDEEPVTEDYLYDSAPTASPPPNIVTSWGNRSYTQMGARPKRGAAQPPVQPPAQPRRISTKRHVRRSNGNVRRSNGNVRRSNGNVRRSSGNVRRSVPKARAAATSTTHHNSSEEQELERIRALHKEVAVQRKKNEASYKAAMAGDPPPKKLVLCITVPKKFNFSTDSRAKAGTLANPYYKEVDFTTQLRKHGSPSKAPKATVSKPFNLSTGNKRKVEGSDAYVSIAQQVEQFQKRTPERYHLRSRKNQERGPSPLKGKHLKTTIPHTPQLMTRQRTRATTAKSSAEIEAEEVDQLHKFKFKARELNRKILESALNPKKPAAKESTKIEAFQLHIEKRLQERQATKKPDETEKQPTFHSQPIPSRILEGVVGVPMRKVIHATIPESPAFALKNRVRMDRKVEEVKLPPPIKANPVPHFGLPFQPRLQVTQMAVCPFSFEEREQERRVLKEKRLDGMRNEEVKLPPPIKANPVPHFGLPFQPRLQVTQVAVCPFSFEEREQERRVLKEKRLDGMRNEEVPKFKAQLLPNFHEVVGLPEKKVTEPTKPEPFRMLVDQRGAIKNDRWEVGTDAEVEESSMTDADDAQLHTAESDDVL